MKLRYFKVDEFKCKCGSSDCRAVPTHFAVLLKIDQVRQELGEPIIINSGSRCIEHNSAVGGTENSYHLKGMAIDIHTHDGKYAFKLINLLIKNGFTGIGVKSGMIHADIRDGKPVLFSYS